MNPIVRNVIAVVAGFVVASLVNMALVTAGPFVFPPPAGADLTTIEGLRAAMPQLEPQHFVFPFLAHSVGTLTGAFVAAWFAASHKVAMAMVVGALCLVGGVSSAFMLPAPEWFLTLDLVVAYLPMAWLGALLATRPRTRTPLAA